MSTSVILVLVDAVLVGLIGYELGKLRHQRKVGRILRAKERRRIEMVSRGKPTMDKVRVLRIIEYVGDREPVEETIRKSIHGRKQIDFKSGTVIITAATIGDYPGILNSNNRAVRNAP